MGCGMLLLHPRRGRWGLGAAAAPMQGITVVWVLLPSGRELGGGGSDHWNLLEERNFIHLRLFGTTLRHLAGSWWHWVGVKVLWRGLDPRLY